MEDLDEVGPGCHGRDATTYPRVAVEPEPWIERTIREAIERGELRPTVGLGEPIGRLDGSYDPAWWVKAWLERERAASADDGAIGGS
jgi:hypothetical protein